MKKSHSQAELGRRGRGGKLPSLTKQGSLTQVKSQLARVSVSSRGSLQQGSSVDSISSAGSSSGSSRSPLVHHRRMSLGATPHQATPTRRKAPPTRGEAGNSTGPPLPKLAVRKSPPKQAANQNSDAESAEVAIKKSGREIELEGEIEKLKGDLAKAS